MTCSVEGCSRDVVARGLCGRHVQRFYKHGDPTVTLMQREHADLCEVDGCSRPYYGRGFCRMHHGRFRSHGDATLADRLAESQSGTCSICGREPSGKGHEGRLHLDHDHISGEFRGMLCGPCNKAIGLLGDDPHRVLIAHFYLLGYNPLRVGNLREVPA